MVHAKEALNKTILVAIASLVSVIISFYDHFPFSFIAVVTTFVLLQLFPHELYRKTIERVLGPLFNAAISALIIFLCRDNWMLAISLLAALVFVCIYFYTQGFYPYSMVLGALTTALMASFVFTNSNAVAYHFGFYWVVNIIIGAIVAVVSLFLLSKILQLKRTATNKSKVVVEKFHLNPVSSLVALRVLLTIGFIIFITDYYNYDEVIVQAVIAGVIVAAQLDLRNTHHRLLFRFLGVVLGAFVAVFYSHLIVLYPSIYWAGCLIIVTLALCTFLAEMTPKYLEYMFLQAGIMLPLILMDKSATELYNFHIAIDRGAGSIVGGVIALILAYLFHWPIKKFETKQNLQELG